VIFGADRLARRRLALVERSAAQRRALGEALAPLMSRAAFADSLVTSVRSALPWISRALTLYTLLKAYRRHAHSTAATIRENSAATKA
jgi:hypothetical protein